MNIAIASGKGGTGKTTVSASLARIWPNPVIAVDMDVEEPNLHLFLKPEITHSENAYMDIPVADTSKCTYCRACSELCQFKAIAVFGDILMVFPEMCHGCGGCMAICPEGVLTVGKRELGDVSWGKSGEVDFISGRLRVGEAMSPPLMREVKKHLASLNPVNAKDVIVDAPPGVSCPAVNAVMDSDVILLVTEPTPFGLYDLQLACTAFQPLGKPLAVIINRWGIGNQGVEDFCRQTGIPILANIPYQRDIAEAYSRGETIVDVIPAVKSIFTTLVERIRSLVAVPKETEHA
jgi:MinD superfamily P-loop ATPase